VSEIYGDSIDNAENIVISDAQKGLKKAIKNELPNVETFICQKHLAGDVLLNCGGSGPEVKQFYGLANATLKGTFDELRSKITPKLEAYLEGKGESQWSKLHVEVCLHKSVASTVMTPPKYHIYRALYICTYLA